MNERLSDVFINDERPENQHRYLDFFDNHHAFAQYRHRANRRDKKRSHLVNFRRSTSDFANRNPYHTNRYQLSQKPHTVVKRDFRLSDHRRVRQ